MLPWGNGEDAVAHPTFAERFSLRESSHFRRLPGHSRLHPAERRGGKATRGGNSRRDARPRIDRNRLRPERWPRGDYSSARDGAGDDGEARRERPRGGGGGGATGGGARE